MTLTTLLKHFVEKKGQAIIPFAGQQRGIWIEGTISTDHLNKKYGEYNDLIKNTIIESHKLYFKWLKKQDISN